MPVVHVESVIVHTAWKPVFFRAFSISHYSVIIIKQTSFVFDFSSQQLPNQQILCCLFVGAGVCVLQYVSVATLREA